MAWPCSLGRLLAKADRIIQVDPVPSAFESPVKADPEVRQKSSPARMPGRDDVDREPERLHGRLEHLRPTARLILAERRFSLSCQLLQQLRGGGSGPVHFR
jgi:hypothetical protein